MIVPVFTPSSRIDATNIAEFAETVREYVDHHGCMVIDCSEVDWIAASGMHVLEIASHHGPITLVNPNPTVHLMAATFGGDIQCRDDRSMSPVYEPGMSRRLVSVCIGGKVAS